MSSSDGNEEVTRRKSSKNTIPPSYIPQGDPNTSCHRVEYMCVHVYVCVCSYACIFVLYFTSLHFTVFMFTFFFTSPVFKLTFLVLK